MFLRLLLTHKRVTVLSVMVVGGRRSLEKTKKQHTAFIQEAVCEMSCWNTHTGSPSSVSTATVMMRRSQEMGQTGRIVNVTKA